MLVGKSGENERTSKILEMYSEENPGVTFDGQFSEWNDYWNKWQLRQQDIPCRICTDGFAVL